MKKFFSPQLRKEIRRNRCYYLFVLPGICFYLLFRYVPMYFIQIAFRDYRVTRPLGQSEWAGLKYFEELFSTPGFYSALANTFIINFYKLLICFPVPIILAILLNELRFKSVRKGVQTILYLPHFISWVVVGSILTNLLTVNNGVVNGILENFEIGPIHFLSSPEWFRGILVVSELWKDAGYSAIIFLAALSAIDPQLYEAAQIDGANWLQRTWSITLSGIKDTIIVLLILRIGSMLLGNFDQVFTILSQPVYGVGDTLDTFVYRVGIQNNSYSLSAAAGLFNTVVAAVMLFLADRFAKRFGEQGLF